MVDTVRSRRNRRNVDNMVTESGETFTMVTFSNSDVLSVDEATNEDLELLNGVNNKSAAQLETQKYLDLLASMNVGDVRVINTNGTEDDVTRVGGVLYRAARQMDISIIKRANDTNTKIVFRIEARHTPGYFKELAANKKKAKEARSNGVEVTE